MMMTNDETNHKLTLLVVYEAVAITLGTLNTTCPVAKYLAITSAAAKASKSALPSTITSVGTLKWSRLAKWLNQPTIPDDATRNMVIIGMIGAAAAEAFIEFTWPEQPKPVGKQKYIARLLVVVEGDDNNDAHCRLSRIFSGREHPAPGDFWHFAATNGEPDMFLPVVAEIDADQWHKANLNEVWRGAQMAAGERSTTAATPAPEPAETSATDARCEDIAPSTRAEPARYERATYGLPLIVAVTARTPLEAVYKMCEAMDMTIVSAWNVWTLPGGETLPAKPIAGAGENVSMVDLSAVYRDAK